MGSLSYLPHILRFLQFLLAMSSVMRVWACGVWSACSQVENHFRGVCIEFPDGYQLLHPQEISASEGVLGHPYWHSARTLTQSSHCPDHCSTLLLCPQVHATDLSTDALSDLTIVHFCCSNQYTILAAITAQYCGFNHNSNTGDLSPATTTMLPDLCSMLELYSLHLETSVKCKVFQ